MINEIGPSAADMYAIRNEELASVSRNLGCAPHIQAIHQAINALRTELTDTQAKLVAACDGALDEAAIAVYNALTSPPSLEHSKAEARTISKPGPVVAVEAIRALKSTTPQPTRDDAWELRLIRWMCVQDQWNSIVPVGSPAQILAAFLAQDKDNANG